MNYNMQRLIRRVRLTCIRRCVIVKRMKPLHLTLAAALLLAALLACNLPFRLGEPEAAPPASPSPAASETPGPPPAPTATPQPTPTPIPLLRIESGETLLFNGDWETALEEFSAAQAGGDAETRSAALLGSARAYLMARDPARAEATITQFLSEFPDSPMLPHAYFFQAQALNAQERYSEAAGAYLEYLARRPGVIDAYVLDLRGEALFAAGDYGGAANDFQGALQSPSLLDESYLRLKLARAYAVSGDTPTALALYDDLYARTNNEYTRALIDLRKGQAYTALGKPAEAEAAYRDAIDNYPTTYDAYTALTALLESGAQVDELQAGQIYYNAGQYGQALAAFDHYLQQNPADPAAARYYYGLSHRAQGSYQQALQQWEMIIQNFPDSPYWDDAWEQKAYTQWAFQEDYQPAIETLVAFVEDVPGHARAAEFLFDAGLVAERAGQPEKAAEYWQKLYLSYPDYAQAPRALFLAGINHYRRGDYQAAQDSFQRYLPLAAELGERAAAQFWTGKAQAAAGDASGAKSSWETAASIDPTGYYSERARDLLHDRPPFDPPGSYDLAFDRQAERLKAEEWVRKVFSLAPEIDLSNLGELANEGGLQRGAELWRLGMYDDARAEFEGVRQAYSEDPTASYRLANYFLEMGAYRSAIMAARQVLVLAMMNDAESLSAPAHFSHIRFGPYYSDLVLPLAQEYGFHPLFLYALIRQESLFDTHVASSAAARGLMQIIPATGEEIQRNLGWPENYTVDDLNRPLVNLRFGTDYLDTQRRHFDGNIYASLAAYNGGPGNAARWLESASEDPDLLLEMIRFEETRNYLRGIYELFTIYRLIYDRTP